MIHTESGSSSEAKESLFLIFSDLTESVLMRTNPPDFPEIFVFCDLHYLVSSNRSR